MGEHGNYDHDCNCVSAPHSNRRNGRSRRSPPPGQRTLNPSGNYDPANEMMRYDTIVQHPVGYDDGNSQPWIGGKTSELVRVFDPAGPLDLSRRANKQNSSIPAATILFSTVDLAKLTLLQIDPD